LFDYVLTINAGEIKSTSDATLGVGIGYNPVATSIVVANDGGKIITGYGMQTELIAIGFVISYMSQSSAVSCDSTTAQISGYNTLVVWNNPAVSSAKTITTAEECATRTTWSYQADWRASSSTCNGYSCIGVSQPFFGIAEDWAHGNTTTSKPEFYVIGAIEFSGAGATVEPRYGTGAYEVRVVKLDVSGTMLWDNGDEGSPGADKTLRSNCVFTSLIHAIATPCIRTDGHSVFLSARMSDNDATNNDRFMMVGGVGLSPQSPLMYKNGWQFTLGLPLLYRLLLT
jgi:hypothetical protein